LTGTRGGCKLRRMAKPRDLIPLHEARELIGASEYKMTALIKNKMLRFYTNPMDKRYRYVSKSEVLKLKERYEEAA
jgi:hypothetical protein